MVKSLSLVRSLFAPGLLCFTEQGTSDNSQDTQQAFIWYLLNAGLVLATGMTGDESRQSWDPQKEVCR